MAAIKVRSNYNDNNYFLHKIRPLCHFIHLMKIKACTVSGIRGRTEDFSSQEHTSVTAMGFIWFYTVKKKSLSIWNCKIHIQKIYCNTENFPCAFSQCFQLSNQYKFEPYVVGLSSGFEHGVCVLCPQVNAFTPMLFSSAWAPNDSSSNCLDVEAQEAYGRGFQTTKEWPKQGVVWAWHKLGIKKNATNLDMYRPICFCSTECQLGKTQKVCYCCKILS